MKSHVLGSAPFAVILYVRHKHSNYSSLFFNKIHFNEFYEVIKNTAWYTSVATPYAFIE